MKQNAKEKGTKPRQEGRKGLLCKAGKEQNQTAAGHQAQNAHPGGQQEIAADGTAQGRLLHFCQRVYGCRQSVVVFLQSVDQKEVLTVEEDADAQQKKRRSGEFGGHGGAGAVTGGWQQYEHFRFRTKTPHKPKMHISKASMVE